MAGIYAHVHGDTVLTATRANAETLDSWCGPLLEGTAPNARWSDPVANGSRSLDCQRAVAIPQQEKDQKRANVQALPGTVSPQPRNEAAYRDKPLARREERLRETDDYGFVAVEKDLERREQTLREKEVCSCRRSHRCPPTPPACFTLTARAAGAFLDGRVRCPRASRAQGLHAELLRTAAQLREAHADAEELGHTHAEELRRAELAQAKKLRQTEAQLDERREVLRPPTWTWGPLPLMHGAIAYESCLL